jgi:hypothetical protein
MMEPFLQLMDITTGNLVAEFESDQEAIAALGRVQEDEGAESIADYALFRFLDGHPVLIAKQLELVRLVSIARQELSDSSDRAFQTQAPKSA